ncbi:hypothetical protein Scep_016457 [Stephania cephalantha]|uniref:Reverse transcriptase domain-containing protein n=1 Tax=Stephania cephalantha TaxID=152367 RepID=A0AAP0IMN6_9MAGN
MANNMEFEFTEREIAEALKDYEGDNAPGKDDFTMAFIKQSWGLVRNDILKVFKDFYRTGEVNAVVNKTLICLIPKKLQARRLKEFRPISLVTCLYKLIAKVLAAHLRVALKCSIVREQGAFLQGRQMIDLILSANEAVNDVRRRKNEGFVMKLDFEKGLGPC